MPKYKVTIFRTSTTHFEDVEIEAPDHSAAQAHAKTMAANNMLSEMKAIIDWKFYVSKIWEGKQ